MKKKIMYLIIPMLFLIGMYEVKAAGATCVYSYTGPNNGVTNKFKCEIDENTVDCYFLKSDGSKNTYYSADYSFISENFQADKKWKCKSEIKAYPVSHGTTGSSTYYLYLPEVECDKCDRTFSLVKSESADGGAVSDESPIGDPNAIFCQYGDLIISFNKNKAPITHNNPCSRTNLNFDASNLTDCPSRLWVYGYQGSCWYHLNKQNAGGWIDLNSDDPIPDADGDDKSGNTDPPTKPGEKTYGCGILGGTDSETVKLLSWAMKIIRLGVPILIIILGMIDFLQILFSGEDKVFKDAFAKFVKRLIIGVCIIFIPYIIQLLIHLSGVDTQYGIDNFFCGIIDETSGVKVESNNYNDPQECVQGGYYWLPVSNTCVESLGDNVKTKGECLNNGYKWKTESIEYGGYCYRQQPSSIKDDEECEKIGFRWEYASEEYGGHCLRK